MSGETPRRLAISLATSTSKPFHVPVCTSYHDCGLYFGSVAIRKLPVWQTCASASPADVSTPAHTPVPAETLDPPAEVVELSLLQATPMVARTATVATATRVRKIDIDPSLSDLARGEVCWATIGPCRVRSNATGPA